MKQWLIVGLSVAVAQCAGAPAQQGGSVATKPQATSRPGAGLHVPLDRILRASVRGGLIDYLAIRTSHRGTLRKYLDTMAKVRVDKLPKPGRLVYYINLYNATMIDVIVDRVAAGYTPAANDYGVFKEPLVRTATGKISLNDLENKVIRPKFSEPRIHVALVCGAKSCPPILPRAYRVKDLEALLEKNMHAFLSDPSRNVVDTAHKKLKLSQIFNWYKVDFGGDDGLVGYVDRYTKASVKGFAVEFIPYSWELNIHKPSGRWASLTKTVQGLAKGAYVEVVGENGATARVRDPAGKMRKVDRSILKRW